MQVKNLREDFLSRTKGPREGMLRFTIHGGKLVLDNGKSPSGRGFYLAKSNLQAALDTKAFARMLHRPLTAEEEEALRKL